MSSAIKITSARMEDIVGAENSVFGPEALESYSVDGISPAAAVRPANVQEVAEIVKFAAAENLAIIPTGARTKLGIGMPPARYDLALDMTRMDHLISYDPGDLTLSAEPGIPLTRLATVLAEHNQFLPLAVPYFERATVGGTLASGVDSPLRQFYGTTRDFVLGMEFITGDGAPAKSGGRVVKNVTGYDLHKLMLGAIGSLGVITRVNFKTFPLPTNRTIFLVRFSNFRAAIELRSRIVASPLSPLMLEIFNSETSVALFGNDAALPRERIDPGDWLVATEFAGPEAMLARCSREIPEFARASGAHNVSVLSQQDGATFCEHMGESTRFLAAFGDNCAVLKISTVPSSFPEVIESVSHHAGEQHGRHAIVIRGCGVIYAAFSTESQARERAAAFCRAVFEASARGDFTVRLAACTTELKREINFWGPPRADFPLMQRVKRAFDPHGIFAPGRFVGGL